MRVGVIGAGAVGGALAALLDRAGHEVEVTARGAHLAAIREGGIRLTGGWGDHVARVDAAEVLRHEPELAIVATKAQDAEAAVRQNLATLRNATILVMQNGLDGVATVERALPGAAVVGGLALFASSYLSPGEIRITSAAPTYLGVPEGDDTAARAVADVLDAVMPVSVLANFRGAQWTKLVVNQVNALPAITNLSVQEVISHRGLRRIMTASIREMVRVGLDSGIRFEALQGLDHGMLRRVAAAPLWLGQLLPLRMKRMFGSTPNPASTLQSIRRGQATEIDYLNGAVVRAAAAVGRDAPVNARLVQLVHEVEETGVFLTPAETVARFRAQ
jgi:2-dehydropantoate 2-reductase